MQTGERYLRKRIFSLFFLGIKSGLLVGLLSGCGVSGYLSKEKSPPLLRSNKLEFKSPEPMPLDTRLALQSELSSFYRQKPPSKPLFPLWWYFRYRDKTSAFARFAMKRFAEPPVFLDEALTERTKNNFQNYMRQRGYLEAQCHYEVRVKERVRRKRSASPRRWQEAAVYYTIDLGRLHRIESVGFTSPHPQVDSILHRIAGGSWLRPNGALDRNTFDSEKNRITYEMRNRGYAFFQPANIEFLGDSSDTRTRVTVEVELPEDSVVQRIYRVGQVEVFLDFVPDLVGTRQDTTLEGIYFSTSSAAFAVQPRRLLSIIAFRPDSLYRQQDFDLTARNLNALGVFQFVTIRPQADSLMPGRINITIALSLNKAFSTGFGAELNSSTNSSSQVSGQLLGLSGFFSANHRNLLRGAENFRSDLSASLELNILGANAPSSNLFFSQEFKFQNELLFPRYFDYLGMWRRMNRMRIVPNQFYASLRRDGRVRMSLNYNYLRLTDFYSYNLINAAWGYAVRTSSEHQYIFDNIGIDVLRPRTEAQFDSTFGRNEFLRRSFGDQLFTGFLLRSFTYQYLSRTNVFGERWFFRLNTELSGLEEHVLNRLWAIPFGSETWTIAGLDFAKYVRLDANGSYTRDFTKDVVGVLRLGGGVALPFGNTTDVPFVKQFFVGGPAGLRAWRIREIGPGGYVVIDEATGKAKALGPPFYQAADFRFEFNAELRFPLFWWLKGAVFVDAGNIWTLKPDPERPEAHLAWNSYRNIALGTGFGLRLDFDYFVFRVDLGLKLRRPYTTPTEGHWVDWSGGDFREISNLNIAIGYPF